MKKNFSVVKKLLVMFLIVGHVYVCGMEKNYTEKSIIPVDSNFTTMLLSLPNEMFRLILAHSVDTTQPLRKIIQPSLSLMTTCKKANSEELLMMIGKVCKCYGSAEKNEAMKIFLNKVNDYTYCHRRNGAYLLTYAGADNNVGIGGSLLCNAIYGEDISMLTALFNNNVSPNQPGKYDDPDFFNIKTVAMAQKFIDQGVNVNMQGHYCLNVLWFCIIQKRSSDLFKFWLEHNVDVRKLNVDRNNECIMHDYVRGCDSVYNTEKHKDIGELLLKAASDTINIVNQEREIPLDILKRLIKREWISSKNRKLCEDVIVLFEKYGGKIPQELKQEQRNAKSENNEPNDCMICLGKSDNMIHLPCPEVHPDWICKGCLDGLLKHSHLCPLCRTALS